MWPFNDSKKANVDEHALDVLIWDTIPIITQSKIDYAINKFTEEYGCMPRFINGKYIILAEIMNMIACERNAQGYHYVTCFNPIELKLDITAENWFLS